MEAKVNYIIIVVFIVLLSIFPNPYPNVDSIVPLLLLLLLLLNVKATYNLNDLQVIYGVTH